MQSAAWRARFLLLGGPLRPLVLTFRRDLLTTRESFSRLHSKRAPCVLYCRAYTTTQIVGRLAAQIAPIIRGKHKPTFCPNDDCGDVVVVVNANAVEFTGNKWQKKVRLRLRYACTSRREALEVGRGGSRHLGVVTVEACRVQTGGWMVTLALLCDSFLVRGKGRLRTIRSAGPLLSQC